MPHSLASITRASSAGYPSVPITGQHAKTLADLWRAAGEDLEAVTRAVGAFFADRDPFTVKNGHSIGEFGRTSARWLAVAAGTAPTAEMAGSIRSGGATALLFGDES